ncbi:MAG: hypothetical protein LBB91_10765 [Clostridiales bacterium]|jgi:hypothetical protein|nr:hypothetical protein [Clostridiales bacterium]
MREIPEKSTSVILFHITANVDTETAGICHLRDEIFEDDNLESNSTL